MNKETINLIEDLINKNECLIGFLNVGIDKEQELGIKIEWEDYKKEKLGDFNYEGKTNEDSLNNFYLHN